MIYKYSVTTSSRAIYFENLSFVKLREFNCLLDQLKYIAKAIRIIHNERGQFKSKRLRDLVSIKNKQRQIVDGTKDEDLEVLDQVLGKQSLGGSDQDDDDEEDVKIKEVEDPPDTEFLFPNIIEEVAEFEAMIKWKANGNGEKIPEPVATLNPEYDRLKDRAKNISKQLDVYLKDI
jgi:hypothetical protein